MSRISAARTHSRGPTATSRSCRSTPTLPTSSGSSACARRRAAACRGLTSATAVHNVLRDEYPAVLERLYRGYSFHRRGEEQPGELPYTPYRVPVYSNTEGNVSARYVRTYVEAGEAAAGRPMDDTELAVL